MLELFIFLFIAGLIFGSFANVCIYRMPREESMAFPSSHCPSCKHRLLWRDNVPLFGFLLLKGKCRFCRAPIPLRYPLVEFAMACAFAWGGLLVHRPHGALLLSIYLWMAFNWLTITVIDYQHRIIPDELSLSLIGFGWLIAAWNPLLGHSIQTRILHSFTASLGSGLAMLTMAWLGEKAFKKEALGGGDVKLIAGFGAVLGWSGAAAALIFGSMAGALVGLILLAVGKKKLGQTIPFGPFLNLGSIAGFIFPAWWRYFFPFS
jgi:leader peptidase (prepilin peptidase)/N-methyltransferase